MVGDTYKVKLGKYRGQELRNIPPSYLIFIYDNNYYMENPVKHFICNNYEELKKLIKK